jgi:hypothetical protein
VPSPLYYDGRVYLVKDGGLITSLAAKSGEPLYAQARLNAIGSYYASPVAADGRIYLASLSRQTDRSQGWWGQTGYSLHQAEVRGEPHFCQPPLSGKTKPTSVPRKHLWAFGER